MNINQIKQIWRVYFIIIALVLGIVALKKYQELPKSKPIIDMQIIDKKISYYKGFETYSDKTIRHNGLLDIDTADKNYIGFEMNDKIKTVLGKCKVIGGNVKFDGRMAAFNGGTDDVWDDLMSYTYNEQLQKPAKLISHEFNLPLRGSDLHKNMIFDVEFEVIYPRMIGNGKFDEIKEKVSKQFELYLISKDEMRQKSDYTKWKNRGSQVSLVIILSSIAVFMIGFGLLYKNKA